MTNEILQTFATLGTPECVGKCFAITRKGITDNFGSLAKLEKNFSKIFPRPDYEHRVWLDSITDNVIVVRADKDGRYVGEDGKEISFGKRLR